MVGHVFATIKKIRYLPLQEPYAQSLTQQQKQQQQHSHYTANLVLDKSTIGDTFKRKLLAVRHRTKLLALHNGNNVWEY